MIQEKGDMQPANHSSNAPVAQEFRQLMFSQKTFLFDVSCSSLQASQPQLGLEAFMRPVESDALGGTLDSPPTSGQVTQSDAAPVLQQQHQAAKESVANVLEQLDDIMQVGLRSV